MQWVEHYVRSERELREGMPAYALVAFDSYRPRRVARFGRERVAIGRPSWTWVDRVTVEQRVGQPLDDDAERAAPS